MKVAGYVRVSYVGDRADTMQSPETQINACRKLTADRGWEFDEDLTRECIDLDQSAYKLRWDRRPGLSRLVEAVRAGQIGAIVAYRLDRVVRSTRDLHSLLDELHACNADLVTADLSIDTASPVGQFTRVLLSGVAQLESANISARVSANARQRALAGRKHGGRAPMWLDRMPDRSFSVNEDITRAIQFAAEMRLLGHGWYSIAAQLNRDGHRTRTGKPWTASSMHDLFADEYTLDSLSTGAQFYQRPRRGKRDKHKTDPIRVENVYPPILTPEIADQIRLVNARQTGANRGTPGRSAHSDKYLVVGLLRCAECGLAWVSRSVGVGKNTYGCTGVGAEHTQSHVRKNMLDDALRELLRFTIADHHERGGYKQEPRSKTDIQRALRALDTQIERLADAYALGGLTRAQYQMRLQMFKEHRSELTSEVSIIPEIDLPRDIDSLPDATWRDTALRVWKSVTYPHYHPDIRKTAKHGKIVLRPMARVVEVLGGHETVFWVPVYQPRWQHTRHIFQDLDGQPDLQNPYIYTRDGRRMIESD